MDNSGPIFNYEEESTTARLTRKSRESPFMVIGIAGCLAACGIGAYKFKTKGKMSTSVYLMQLRVIAQGTVVGALMVGICYQMYTDHIKPKFKDQ